MSLYIHLNIQNDSVSYSYNVNDIAYPFSYFGNRYTVHHIDNLYVITVYIQLPH